MIRKYNSDFINEYNEQEYNKYLRTINYLDILRNNYNHRYDQDYLIFDGSRNLFKESLDHYVLKRMEEDNNFINTKECDNYFGYLRKLSNTNNYDYCTNIVLCNVLGNSKFSNYKQKYIGIYEKDFRKKNDNYTLKINNIYKKIRGNQSVSQEELNLICGFIADYRENTPMMRDVIKYIFNNLTRQYSELKCSPQIVSTILTYIPYSCSEIKKNGFDPGTVRMYASNIRGRYIYNKVAASKKDGKEIILNGRKFSKIDFKSIKASESTYPADTLENDDFTLLMIVAYHEIVHQYQSYMSKVEPLKIFYNSDFFEAGYPMAVKNILNEELNDYGENHDNDDIEIHATKVGWEMCNNFYRNVLVDGSLKRELLGRCYKNKNGTNSRHSFAIKKDKDGKLIDAVKYNNDNLFRIMSNREKREKYFKEMPSLRYIFSDSGQFRLDILFLKNFGSTQIGASLFEKLINTDCIDDKIRGLIQSKKYGQDSINIATTNIYAGINFANRRLSMLEYYTRCDFDDGFRVNRSFLEIADNILNEQSNTIKNGMRILNQVFNCHDYDELMDSRIRMAIYNYKKIIENINKSSNLQNKGKKK